MSKIDYEKFVKFEIFRTSKDPQSWAIRAFLENDREGEMICEMPRPAKTLASFLNYILNEEREDLEVEKIMRYTKLTESLSEALNKYGA